MYKLPVQGQGDRQLSERQQKPSSVLLIDDDKDILAVLKHSLDNKVLLRAVSATKVEEDKVIVIFESPQ